MSKCVFQAGFSWRVVGNKWPGFVRAFHGFDPRRNAALSDADLDAHLKDTGIIRNARKIISVQGNALFTSPNSPRSTAARPPSSPPGRTTISPACWS